MIIFIFVFKCSIVILILLYSGNTAFILAAGQGHLNILEFLLTKGSSVDEKNNDGKMKLFFIFINQSIFLSISR